MQNRVPLYPNAILCTPYPKSYILITPQHPPLNNPHLIQRPILRPRLHQPHPLHNPHTLRNASKNRMFPIQPRRRRQGNKELTSIRIRPAIRHTQYTRPSMFELGRDFVFELFAVDGGPAAAGAGGIAGLQHEVGDYAVEEEGVVVAAFGEGAEVFAGLGWVSEDNFWREVDGKYFWGMIVV